MAHWNYRVIKRTFRTEAGVTETYRIHEVYYDDSGKIEGWAQDLVAPYGESIEELTADLSYLAAALEKPVLVDVDGTLVEEGKQNGDGSARY